MSSSLMHCLNGLSLYRTLSASSLAAALLKGKYTLFVANILIPPGYKCNDGSATESSRQSSDDCYVNDVIAVSSRSERTKESERQESSQT